jgi:hypothetical protein
LTKQFDLDKIILKKSIESTFARRLTPLPVDFPIALTSDFYESSQKNIQWWAFLRKNQILGIDIELKSIIEYLALFFQLVFNW